MRPERRIEWRVRATEEGREPEMGDGGRRGDFALRTRKILLWLWRCKSEGRVDPAESEGLVGADPLVPDRLDRAKEGRAVAGRLVGVVGEVGVELEEEERVGGEGLEVVLAEVGGEGEGGEVERSEGRGVRSRRRWILQLPVFVS